MALDSEVLWGVTTSSGNVSEVIVDFGFPLGNEGDTARTTVAAPWIGIIPKLSVFFAGTTPDHEEEDAAVEGLVATVAGVIPGIGFDILAYAPNNTWGRYRVIVVGV